LGDKVDCLTLGFRFRSLVDAETINPQPRPRLSLVEHGSKADERRVREALSVSALHRTLDKVCTQSS
jgi:hypothetical protein